MISSLKMDNSKEVTLKPMHRLPIFITILGIPILIAPFPSWLGISIIIFGLFLLVQSFTLRLKFTEKDLIVLQLNLPIFLNCHIPVFQ